MSFYYGGNMSFLHHGLPLGKEISLEIVCFNVIIRHTYTRYCSQEQDPDNTRAATFPVCIAHFGSALIHPKILTHPLTEAIV
jgi:hypothetical protein